MSWIRSNLAKVGTFAGSVVQKAGDAVERGAKMVYEQAESAVKAGDAVERGAKMVYEQAESAVVGRPHNSFRHAIRRIEEVASFARGSERKEALARWLAALSDIQQENDRLQAQFQRRKKRQEKEERKTQGGNQQEEVTAESAASAEGSASDAGAAVSSGRTEGVGAEGAVADRADDEGKDHASVTEGNQAKDGEAEGVEAGLSSQVQTDGAEGKTEEHKYRPQVGSKSAEAGDIAAAGEEAEEVASVGDGSSQDEGAPPLSKSASTGRASMVSGAMPWVQCSANVISSPFKPPFFSLCLPFFSLSSHVFSLCPPFFSLCPLFFSLCPPFFSLCPPFFSLFPRFFSLCPPFFLSPFSPLPPTPSQVLFYDPDAGNEALNFRDVFLRSSALELIVASMVVAPGDEDEMALLRGLFGLCVNLSSTQCNDLLAALQSLGSSLSAYSELKLPSDDLATMVAEAITGLKVNPEIERVDLESCRLQQLIAEAASVAASVPAAYQRSASLSAAFEADDLAAADANAAASANAGASSDVADSAAAVAVVSDAADATSSAAPTGSGDGAAGSGADDAGAQASTDAVGAASASEPAAPAEADGAAAEPATTAEPTNTQSEPAANTATTPTAHTISSPPPPTRDAVTHVNEVVTARSRDALRLGLRLLALEKKKEALLQLGDTPGDRALKVERVSCLAAELSESMEGLRRKAEECRQQRQEALAYRSSKAQEAREAEKVREEGVRCWRGTPGGGPTEQVQKRKEELEEEPRQVLLAEAQQGQKRKEELEEELRQVQAAPLPSLLSSFSCLLPCRLPPHSQVLLAGAQQVQKRKEELEEEVRQVQAALLPSLFSLPCLLPHAPTTHTNLQVLLSEAQQVQKRKEELEEELRRVQAALDGVNRRLVKLEEEKELFSQASSGIEAHLSSEHCSGVNPRQVKLEEEKELFLQASSGIEAHLSSEVSMGCLKLKPEYVMEESLTHSLSEHEEDAKALSEWKQFLQQSWQLQQASMEGKERQMREEMSDRKSRFWEMAQGHVRLCKSELEAFGQSAKSIVERLDGIRAKREQAEKEGKDGAVSDSKHRRLQWEERYMAAEIQVGAVRCGSV
ncbi:unnamed protein product [Closterium sp. NIES-53]